jgi:Zn-finger nucleic acid-binding protein
MVDMIPREQLVTEHRNATVERPLPVVKVVASPDDLYDLTLEEFEMAIPSQEMMADFPDGPHRYWEPFEPGCELKYLPRYPSFNSSASGVWVARNQYEELLITQRLSRYGNPQRYRVDEKEVKEANRNDEWLQCNNCPFRTTSVYAIRAHNKQWKHSTG